MRPEKATAVTDVIGGLRLRTVVKWNHIANSWNRLYRETNCYASIMSNSSSEIKSIFTAAKNISATSELRRNRKYCLSNNREKRYREPRIHLRGGLISSRSLFLRWDQ
jgi:hypothetical protein